jgi:DNA-binding HxlR family transcriptional regulator
MTKKSNTSDLRPILDALQVLEGKWKLPILLSLYEGKKRFKELERDLCHVTPRMLVKELKSLEIDGLVVRKVIPTVPVSVEYSITECGLSLGPVLISLKCWGEEHRKVAQETEGSKFSD